jgi:hypothetical protein
MDWEVYATSASQSSTLVLQNNKEYQINVDWVSIDSGVTTIPVSKLLHGINAEGTLT